MCCWNCLALSFQGLNLCMKSLIARSFRCSVAVNRKICHHTSLLPCNQLIGTCWQQGWISLLFSWVTVDQEKLSTPDMLSVIWQQQLVHSTPRWQVGKWYYYYNAMLLHCVRCLSRDNSVNCWRNRNSGGSDIFLTNTTVTLCPVKDRNDGANVLHKNKLLTCLALQWRTWDGVWH